MIKSLTAHTKMRTVSPLLRLLVDGKRFAAYSQKPHLGPGGRSPSSRGGGRGIGMEWITVDQLDHALRTCYLTRRALDPQVSTYEYVK